MSLHGSSLPQLFEGAPYHSDTSMVSFNVEADTNGVFPYAGALVTLATDAAETCKISVLQNKFILGVCEESGILQGQINVIIRGLITIQVDNTTVAGDFLDFSTSVDGAAHSVGSSVPTPGIRLVAIQGVTVSSGTQPTLAILI